MPVQLLHQREIDQGMEPEPGRKRTEYCDKDVPGLYLEARAGSEINIYYLRYKDDSGKTCHQRLGRTSEITLIDARKQARELKADIKAGNYPGVTAKHDATGLTLDQFFQDQYLPYKQSRKKVSKDEHLWRLRLRDRFADRKLEALKKVEVKSFLSELHADGLAASTANHYIRLLRHMYNLAIEWELTDKNPAKVPLIPENNKVEHYLDDGQLARLMHVLRTHPNRPVALLALLLLGTGMRLEEGLGLTWSAIDREAGTIRLEATRTKAKRAHIIPISYMVMGVLDELGTEGRHERLFVSRKTGKPLRYVHKVWERIRKEAGLPWLRIHDLRHNFASALINAGESLVTVQVLLNHADISTTVKRYVHLSNKTLGGAVETAGTRFTAALEAAG